MSTTGGVEGPGLGSTNGGGNDTNDTSNDTDTSADVNTADANKTEKDVEAENKVDKTVKDTVTGIVDSIMDAIENITGVDIPDSVRDQISAKVAEYASMSIEDVAKDVIESVLSGLGVPGAKQVAESIVNHLKDPTASLQDLMSSIASNLAKAGIAVADMNPVVKSILDKFTNLADPNYGFSDLMGSLAGLGCNVAAHSALGVMSLGVGNLAAGSSVTKGCDYVSDAVKGHFDTENKAANSNDTQANKRMSA